MSTTTLTAPIRVNTAGVHARPGLGRLVAVELRKMVDTRAGFWLQVAMVALTVVVVVVRLLVGDAAHHTFQSVLDVGLQPAAVLLPVLGILLVTSEWSQRTGLITFALVPVRSRVLGAKLIASLLRAVAMLAMSLAVVAAGVLVSSPGVEGTWSDAAPLIGQSAVYLTTGMVIGVAFGAILLSLRARHRPSLRAADGVDGSALSARVLRRRPVGRQRARPRPDDREGHERHPMGARRHLARHLDGAPAPDRRLADHPTRGHRLTARRMTTPRPPNARRCRAGVNASSTASSAKPTDSASSASCSEPSSSKATTGSGKCTEDARVGKRNRRCPARGLAAVRDADPGTVENMRAWLRPSSGVSEHAALAARPVGGSSVGDRPEMRALLLEPLGQPLALTNGQLSAPPIGWLTCGGGRRGRRSGPPPPAARRTRLPRPGGRGLVGGRSRRR